MGAWIRLATHTDISPRHFYGSGHDKFAGIQITLYCL